MTKCLRRRGLLDADDDDAEEGDASERAGLTRLAASAVSGATPPAGPEWRRDALPLTHRAMVFERPLCVALDGFTLHAATRAGGLDEQGREALLKYILRPAVAQERVTRGADGLVRIGLKKAFSDGTVAVDLDPLSLLSRLCASVPPPRFHTVRYAGVLGSEQAAVASRAEACVGGIRAVRRGRRVGAATRSVSPVGGAVAEDVRVRRARLRAMRGADASARDGHRAEERRALRDRGLVSTAVYGGDDGARRRRALRRDAHVPRHGRSGDPAEARESTARPV